MYKVWCLVERQVCVDAVDEQQPVPVFDHRSVRLVRQLVDKAVFLCLRRCPPACLVHPSGHLVLISACLFHIQAHDAFPDGVHRLDVLLQFLGVVVAVSAHAHRMHHVGAVVCGDHLAAVAGDDGCRAGTQAVDLRRHRRRVLFKLVADCLRCEHVAAAAVDAHRDLVQRSQTGQLLRKLLRGHLVAPPARLRNVAVKQQLYLVSCLIAEFPEFLVFGHFRFPPILPPSALFRSRPPRACAWPLSCAV